MAIVTNFSTSSSVKSSLKYGSNEHKLGDTIALNCSQNSKEAIRDFELPFKISGKMDDSVKINRFVLSFANSSGGNSELNKSDANEYVREFLKRFNSKMLNNKYPIIAFEHLNTDYNHYHIYFPSISLEGNKFHPKLNPMFQSRKINDDLSREFNLKPIRFYKSDVKRQFTRNQIFQYSQKHDGRVPYSYKDHARYLISNALVNSHNMHDFKVNMESYGGGVSDNFYTNLKVGSIYIPFRYKNGDSKQGQEYRKVRTKTLGFNFSKDRLREAIDTDNSKILDKYKPYLKQPATVKLGQYSTYFPAILPEQEMQEHPAASKMEGVDSKDARFNFIRKVKSNSAQINRNSKDIKGNSKQAINQSKFVRNRLRSESRANHKIKQSSSEPVRSPSIKELNPEQKQELMTAKKFGKMVQGAVDDFNYDLSDLTESISEIFDDMSLKSHDFWNYFDKQIKGYDRKQKQPKMKFDYSENQVNRGNEEEQNQDYNEEKSKNPKNDNNEISDNNLNIINRSRKNIKGDENGKYKHPDPTKIDKMSEDEKKHLSVVPDGMSGKEWVKKFKQQVHDQKAQRHQDAKKFNHNFDQKQKQHQKALDDKKAQKARKNQRLAQQRNNVQSFH